MTPVTVPATLDSLGAIADYVLAAAASAGLDKRASYRLRLAVDEIVTNIIVYGYGEADLPGTLELRAALDDNALTVSIEDSGVAYDPRQAPVPDTSLPLEERPIGGLGVYLALKSVDEFLYERVGDRNRSTFTMHLPSAPSNV
jgi:anti-sigma regulatory factor (Ser/Thr protein kinase)